MAVGGAGVGVVPGTIGTIVAAIAVAETVPAGVTVALAPVALGAVVTDGLAVSPRPVAAPPHPAASATARTTARRRMPF
ncbi:MAG: hypothetical protein AUG02_03755 [Chloroflexi bacterium 13_1_20CM_2_70_9]|nr:MAG: hypothetical protein AUG02_03755 [Chloroflexi bacterium 13_1_20CM_2_70_9]